MSRKIRDLLPELGPTELTKLRSCLDDEGPIVTWFYGPTGAGKSAQIAAFAEESRDQGAAVLTVDCRTVEPTVAGLLSTLSELLEEPFPDLEKAADAISQLAGRAIVVFENYEVFRLADSWLRRDFIPALDATARVILVSRESPAAGWVSASEWQAFFQAISLNAASPTDPAEITKLYLDEVPDTELREALDAASVVRRVTKPMLASLVPEANTDEMYQRLSALSFVETRRDGLAIAESVGRLIAEQLQAADVDRYRGYQKSAWRLLRQQLRESSRADLWRCTADVIYLIENPVIREAFFPSESAQFSVEPAVGGDMQAVLDITAMHEPQAEVEIMRHWSQHLPSAFHVLRDSSGLIGGYSCIALPSDLDGDWMQSDPVARNWQAHVNRKGRAARPESLFLRRWLSREHGEAPSPVQAAAWVDVKRTYLELRPELRRVYLTLQDLGPYAPVAVQLGFEVMGDLEAQIGGEPYHSAMLDFGPGSVDGWICDLLAAELGVADDQRLDSAARELITDTDRVPLTPLEFKLVAMLESRQGEAVSREELLREVWGHGYDGGSNVVDALVRGLRKKCGASADMFETVRGVGYRLRA